MPSQSLIGDCIELPTPFCDDFLGDPGVCVERERVRGKERERERGIYVYIYVYMYV
jgi:hypothetical protein